VIQCENDKDILKIFSNLGRFIDQRSTKCNVDGRKGMGPVCIFDAAVFNYLLTAKTVPLADPKGSRHTFRDSDYFGSDTGRLVTAAVMRL
jgi:hypothetical protein